jgi:hypothetical protein
MSAKIDEIVKSLPEADRVLVANKLLELDRKLERLLKHDAAVVDSLVRVLQSRNPQSARLRQLLKDIVQHG